MTDSFKDLNLSKHLQKTIEEAGYKSPTPIQSEVIPHILDGVDVIAKAQTGSGKTAAFSLPAIDLLERHPEKTILVITPTRELALQVCTEMKKYSKHLNISPCPIYGGESIRNQIQRIKQDSRIIVGTPGRLLDLFRSNYLVTFCPQTIVLDEADEMLNMGFLEDIQEIFSFLLEERQTLLFSATLPKEIKRIAEKFLKNPVTCDHSVSNTPHEDIEQIHYLIPDRTREVSLLQLIQYHCPKKAIVFCNTKKQVEELSESLRSAKLPVLTLHGDMTQQDRQRSIASFRNSAKKILIATDVAGRGINVTDVTHVYNLELPYSAECYTHRIGRTGRMGSKGVAVTLITQKQKPLLKKFLKTKVSNIQLTKLPTPDEVKERMQHNFFKNLKDEFVHQDAEPILEMLKEDQPLEEITLKLISLTWKDQAKPLSKFVSSPDEKASSSSKKKKKFKGQNYGRDNFGRDNFGRDNFRRRGKRRR